LVGTSGWQYDSWKDAFYKGVAHKQWLSSYSKSFCTVEVNSVFYRLPERRTFEHWRDETPKDFVFAVKMSRYLTHIRRLTDPQEPVERFADRVAGLDDKLGPILLQLPPSFPADSERLDGVLRRLTKVSRVAVEFRHDSWFSHPVRSVLESNGAALCWADNGGLRTPLWKTAEWGYVRFHFGRAQPPSCYGVRSLETWTNRIVDNWSTHQDVYAFFNNDSNACAVRDAAKLKEMLANSTNSALHKSK